MGQGRSQVIHAVGYEPYWASPHYAHQCSTHKQLSCRKPLASATEANLKFTTLSEGVKSCHRKNNFYLKYNGITKFQYLLHSDVRNMYKKDALS